MSDLEVMLTEVKEMILDGKTDEAVYHLDNARELLDELMKEQ